MKIASMRRIGRRLLPRTIYGQVVSILICSLVATHLVVIALFDAWRPSIPPLPMGLWHNSLALETAIRTVTALPVVERAQMAARISTPAFRFQVGTPFPCTPDSSSESHEWLRQIIVRDFPNEAGGVHFFNCRDPKTNDKFTNISLNNDQLYASVMTTEDFADVIHRTLPISMSFLSLLLMTATLSIWSIWRVNRPLSILAKKAETLGYDIAARPLDEQGPIEVRRVIRAFNRMQTRISAAAAERTLMLMSISHDLRTPLTRLSMRVEMGGEDASPEAMRGDLALMKKMLNGALSFLKGQQEVESFETVELGSLVESLCEEFAVVGSDVTYLGAFRLPCFCQPVAMARAVNNLIENGLKYGKRVQVNAWSEDGQVIIDVQDEGPGIPEGVREQMLQPFARMDRARSSDGSLGLGLSIVNDIMARHHGSLSFRDVQPHGMIVRLTLPGRIRKLDNAFSHQDVSYNSQCDTNHFTGLDNLKSGGSTSGCVLPEAMGQEGGKQDRQ